MCFGKTVLQLFMNILINKVLVSGPEKRIERKINYSWKKQDLRDDGQELLKQHLISIIFWPAVRQQKLFVLRQYLDDI